jgi:hypothetical protein
LLSEYCCVVDYFGDGAGALSLSFGAVDGVFAGALDM